jgi:hypothetical protein
MAFESGSRGYANNLFLNLVLFIIKFRIAHINLVSA